MTARIKGGWRKLRAAHLDMGYRHHLDRVNGPIWLSKVKGNTSKKTLLMWSTPFDLFYSRSRSQWFSYSQIHGFLDDLALDRTPIA